MEFLKNAPVFVIRKKGKQFIFLMARNLQPGLVVIHLKP